MECSSTPEPAYLNLPGWRCVPVYALPYTSAGKSPLANPLQPSVAALSLLPTNIPSDPRQWSRQQVCTWLEWCIESFSLPPLDVEQFYMNGRGLCLLKKADWRDRAPRSGDILHNALQILIQKQLDNSNTTGSYSTNGSSLVSDSVSAALLHHASLHDKSTIQHTPAHGWPRSISSDFHSMGHVVHENEHLNGISMPNMNGSDADSTAEVSPVPSPDNLPSCMNDVRNGNLENGPNSDTSTSVASITQVSHLKQYNEKSTENVSEKINVRLLWDFLQQLLNDPQQRYNCCIMWKDKPKGVFKITDPHRLAGLWGKQKNHLNMNFDKMSRALRYYYRVRILQKEPGERHCYRFLRHPNELRHCKQRSLLTKETGPIKSSSVASLECSDVEAVLDMSIKEEGLSPPGDVD